MDPPNFKSLTKKTSKTVRFSQSDECVPSTSAVNSPEIGKPEVNPSNASIDNSGARYESKILHYLSKLRNYWNSSPVDSETAIEQSGTKETGAQRFKRYNSRHALEERAKRNVMEPMMPRPHKYCSRSRSKMPLHHPLMAQRHPNTMKKLRPLRKAENIVIATIEYGLANGIVSRNGKYFWINEENRLPQRSLTSGIALKQHRCANYRNEDANPKMFNTSAYHESEYNEHKPNARFNSGQISLKKSLAPADKNQQTLNAERSTDVKLKENSKQSTYSKRPHAPKGSVNKISKAKMNYRKRKHPDRYSSSSSTTSVDSELEKKKCNCKECKRKRKEG